MVNPKYSRYYTYIKPVIENKFVKSSTPYIFSLISIAIFIIFAIRPTVITILSLQKDIENHQKILDQLNEKANNLTQGKNNYESLGEDVIANINSAVPHQSDVPSLVKALNSSIATSTSSAIQIQPLTIVDSTPPNPSSTQLSEINFTINTQGTFNEIIASLDKLKKSPRLTNINNVTVTRTENGVLVLSVTGKAYYLK